jgi:hypothetical protein
VPGEARIICLHAFWAAFATSVSRHIIIISTGRRWWNRGAAT